MILPPKTGLEHATQLAEKIRAAVEAHPFTEAGKRTGSFGVACYQEDDTQASLLQRADLAMYQAKKEGIEWLHLGRIEIDLKMQGKYKIIPALLPLQSEAGRKPGFIGAGNVLNSCGRHL